jgi:hypothetical protein
MPYIVFLIFVEPEGTPEHALAWPRMVVLRQHRTILLSRQAAASLSFAGILNTTSEFLS